jgi:hypothetical protein
MNPSFGCFGLSREQIGSFRVGSVASLCHFLKDLVEFKSKTR